MNFKRLSNLSTFCAAALLILFYPLSQTKAMEFTAGQGQNSISGQVFSDDNSNGEMDSGEAGLGGFRVYLDTNQNESFEPGEPSVVTDNTGTFVFSGLAAGMYKVREVQQQGWIETDSVYTTRFTYTVTVGGSNISDLLFGNHLISQGYNGSGNGSGSGSGSGGNSGTGSSSSTSTIGDGSGDGGGSSSSGGGNSNTGGSSGNDGNGGTNASGGNSSNGGNGAPTGSVLGATNPDPGSISAASTTRPQVLGATTTLPRTGIAGWAVELFFLVLLLLMLFSAYRSFRVQK